MTNLWVDDVVPPATVEAWKWAQNYAIAIQILQDAAPVQVLSLDYDLSDFDPKIGKEWKGEDVLTWLERNEKFWPKEIRLHTGNPVGRRRMWDILNSTGLYGGAEFAIYDNFKAYPEARPEKRQVYVFIKKSN